VLQAGYCCANLPIPLKYVQNVANTYKVAGLTAVVGEGRRYATQAKSGNQREGKGEIRK